MTFRFSTLFGPRTHNRKFVWKLSTSESFTWKLFSKEFSSFPNSLENPLNLNYFQCHAKFTSFSHKQASKDPIFLTKSHKNLVKRAVENTNIPFTFQIRTWRASKAVGNWKCFTTINSPSNLESLIHSGETRSVVPVRQSRSRAWDRRMWDCLPTPSVEQAGRSAQAGLAHSARKGAPLLYYHASCELRRIFRSKRKLAPKNQKALPTPNSTLGARQFSYWQYCESCFLRSIAAIFPGKKFSPLLS